MLPHLQRFKYLQTWKEEKRYGHPVGVAGIHLTQLQHACSRQPSLPGNDVRGSKSNVVLCKQDGALRTDCMVTDARNVWRLGHEVRSIKPICKILASATSEAFGDVNKCTEIRSERT